MRRTPLTLAALLAFSTPAAADPVRVELQGVEGELRRNVLANLTIAEAGDVDEARARRLHGQARQEIRVALQPFGHYRPSIDADLRRDGEEWVAEYRVVPGPPLQVATVDVSVSGPGAADPGFQAVVRRFPVEEGDALFHPAYEEGKTRLLQYAAQNGYLDAELLTGELQIDLDRYRAHVVLALESGPRYHFGPVRFEQDFLDENVIRGYVRFEEGEPFDLGKLLELQATMSDSPYFSRVEVRAAREEAVGDRVPIVVTLTPSRRQRWEVGAGYGDDTGPRGRLSLELRRINRQGHRGLADAQASEIESRYSVSYLVPGRYPRTDIVAYSVGLSQLESRVATSELFLAGVNRSQSRGRWRETLGLNYQEEEYVVGLDQGKSTLVVPEAGWRRVVADDRLYPLHGRRLSIVGRGAHESLASDTSFFQLRGDAKWIRELRPDLRILLRLDLGATETDAFRQLPPSFRFFAGGDNSVRGYAFQELGPRDEAGNVIGGEYLATGSVEVDWLFFERWGRWGLAAFWDSGNAFSGSDFDLEHGVGLGIRWLSPVGLVRADAAVPLAGDFADVRFHLSLGPDL